MAFFDAFRQQQPAKNTNQQQPQQNQNPNDPANNQQQNNQQQNNQNPGNGNNPNANPNEPANPLDVYGKMFDNPANSNEDTPPSFNIDPKIMDQVVGGQDFMKGVTPELMQKATSGDAQALMQLMQHASRNAYRAAIEHGGVLTDKFVGAREQYGQKKLPDVLRGHLTEQQLAANTPNYKHPVVKQQLKDIASRLQKTHPDAQPQEIAEMAKDYLQQLMTAITPPDPNAAANNTPKDTDWDKFFED